MATAQIELYPEREPTDEERADPELRAAYFAAVTWGWRKCVLIPDNPERWADTGTVFADRETAFEDATAKNPGWAIG